MNIKTRHKYFFISLIVAVVLASDAGAVFAEEKDSGSDKSSGGVKTWSFDYNKDYHSEAEFTGRFKLRDDDTINPYLVTGGKLDWDTLPTQAGKDPTIKDIYRYDVGVNLGAGLGWNISKGFTVFAEPSLKYRVYEGVINPSVDKKTGEKTDGNLKFGIHYGF